ncbi:protein kinase activating protein dpb11 [Coemansia sp. RSA 2167]|nr:protein kinase activating protein dpb11 [Coemansia sp. RSA 2167]
MKDSLSSNKYRVSAKVGIPVLSVDFLDKCEKEARRRNSVGSDAGDIAAAIQNIVEQTWYWPFTGCLVCTTGFDQDIRDEIKYLTAHTTPADSYNGVEMLARFARENLLGDFDTHLKLIGGGGVYHGVLTPTCTHLIALTPEGQKYKFARQWGVHVVSLKWFLQSLKTGYRQNEADFAFKDDNTSFGVKALTRASSIATRSSSAASGVMEIPPSRSSVVEQPQTRPLASADLPFVVDSDWLRACWEAKLRTAEQPFAISWADVIADKSGNIDAKFGDASEQHVQQHQRSKPRTRRLPAASASDADLLPPQPRYSLNCRSLTDSAQRRSFESQRSALSLVGKPMRSCSVSDDELDPFMNDTATRKRMSSNVDNCRSETQEQPSDRHESKRQRTAPAYQPPDVTNVSSHGPAFSSSPPQLELSARTNDAANDNPDVGEFHIFAKCLFTSLGFSADAQLVLKRIIGENGGEYVDLTSCLPTASSSNSNLQNPLSGTDLQRALSGLSQRINVNGVTDAYLVLQLAGQGDTQLCEDVVARYSGMHVVTECWVEQCLQEGIRYPDFGQMESQPRDLPGLGRGQHVLFRPLRSDVVERMTALTLSLSISGYEGMEREHIGKLAHALGVSFTEKFSRKVSHLICRPPFQGPKFERAVKWNIAVVDSFWLYRLAATGSVVEHTPTAGPINARKESLPPATPASITQKDARAQLSLTGISIAAANTPLAKSSQMLLAGTPGRTPMDVSLERNFNQAIHNNARPRPAYAATPSRHIDDDDATQLSPHHASAAHMALREPNSDFDAVDDSALSRVLGGIVVGLSSRIQHRRVELTEVALQLGCRVLAHFDPKQATHLVHQSLRERDTLRECRTAAKASISVVSPWWLYACRDAQAHVPEAEFPCTFHPERHLKLVSTSPTTPSQKRASKQSNDPAISPVANKTCGGQGCAVDSIQQANMHTSDRQQIEPERASTDIVLAIADTGVIGNMFGKKAARTYRRYRPAQNGAAVEIDLTSDDDGAINTADQLDRRPARSKDSHQPSALSSSSSSSTNSNQPSEQTSAPARGQWWMSVGTAARADYSTQLYSQDIQQHCRCNDLGSMPGTAAVEDALNPELATSYTASALAAADPDSVAETQAANVAPRAHSSPLAANRTTIVYGEDMDALSERDRLIQKLVGR